MVTKTKKTFYVTTPIYYANANPHAGSAYTTIAADILARYNKLLGKQVFFLTGTDEHGQKIQETAEKAGKTPKQFVDEVVKNFKESFKLLNISNDNFIRTTDKEHEKEVKKILQKLYNKKFIYKGFYESYYCVGCEQYLTESDLVDGKCPLHPNLTPELRKEEAYMFKLSAFQDKLLKLIKSGKYEILPEARRKEMITFLENGLKDISISRLKEKIYWGIELPFDKNHTTFVWVDAFWNYLTGLQAKKAFNKFWPPDVQLMAKDIMRVHSTIYPALLLALDYELPKTLFIHGYFTVNGQKMSKSLGNVISPIYLTNKYGADSVRYFLMRNISFGSDGDISEENLINRHNSELANKLGNLVSRVSALAETYGLQKTENKLVKKLKLKAIEKHLENYEFDKALNEIFAFIDVLNEYVQEKKPWETKNKKVLYELADSIKAVSILLSPFIPESSEKISKTFGFELTLKQLKTPLKPQKIKKSEILFQKIEQKTETKIVSNNMQQQKINKPSIPKDKMIEGIANIVDFKDWQKIDLKVGEIENVENIDGADKLYKVTVNIGSETRTICAGLKQFYSPDELKGKKIILFTNLAPRIMKGIESKGMMLAAVNKDETKVSLIQPDADIEVGSKVM